MSNSNFDNIAATTLKNYQPTFADNVTDNIRLLKFMRSEGAVLTKGGESIVRPLMYRLSGNAGSFSGMDSATTNNEEGFTAAEYDWKQIRDAVVISSLEMAQNSSKEQVINLMEAKIGRSQATMEDIISDMIFSDGTGNGGLDLLGLEALVAQDPTTGTIGGINRATATDHDGNFYWRNVVNTAVGAQSQNLETAISTAIRDVTRGNDRPNVIVTNSTIYGYMTHLARQRQRFVTRSSKLAAIGFEELEFEGIPVIWDGKCPADRVYGLNTKHLKFNIHPQYNFTPTEFVKPANQSGKVSLIELYGEMTSDRLESCFVLSGITSA